MFLLIFRQTLEAHMKEKHSDEMNDCIYCSAGQPHPRLSRGESYSCGYKVTCHILFRKHSVYYSTMNIGKYVHQSWNKEINSKINKINSKSFCNYFDFDC